MDEQLTSGCNVLLSLFSNSGSPHTDVRGSIARMHEDNVITEAACSRLLQMLQQRPTPSFPGNHAIPVIEETMTGNPVSQARADLDSEVVPDVSMLSPTEASEYRQLHNQAFNLPSPRTSISDRSHSAIGRWMRRFALFSTISNSTRSLNRNKFLLLVRVEVEGAKTRPATLLIDTGSDFNILGLQLAELICPDFNRSHVECLANTGGGHMEAFGEVPVRWWCEDQRFPRRFENSTFHISASRLDVDAILGWRDIDELDLVSLNANRFVGIFKSLPSRINHTTAASEQAASEVRQQRENDEMRRDDEIRKTYEDRRVKYAHEQALWYANVFATQYQARNGPEGLQQAHRAKYEEVYWQRYNDYHPHPSQ